MEEQDVLDENEIAADTVDGIAPHWRMMKIGELVTKSVILMANGFAQGGYNVDGEGVVHLRPFNVTADGNIDLEQIKYVPAPLPNSPYWVQADDIIFNNTNSETLVGKTAHFSLIGWFVFSNHMTRIRVLDHTQLNSQWLAYYLLLLWNRQVLQSLSRRHVGQASIGLDKLSGITIPLPPLPEQHAIARVLRAVQGAIQARRREIALERERKAALMQQLFTQGTRGEATKDTGFGSIPEQWEILPLERCAYVQTGIAKGRNLNVSRTVALPYLRVANVQDGYLDLSEIKDIELLETEVDRYSLKPGDVLLTEGGDFDKLGRGFIWHGEIPNCVHQNHIFAVRANPGILISRYLAYLIQSSYGKAYFLSVAHRTTNLASINSTKLKALPVPIPPAEEQDTIANTLDASDAQIAALERETALLEELFRALLEELMSGRLSTLPLIGDGEENENDKKETVS